jgi:beta-lactamase regulating signal transducer with metallopeptidase domain
MTLALTLFEHPVVESLGWALLHFVWQGLAIALILALMMWGMRRASAQSRYVVLCCGLVAASLSLAGTFGWLISQLPAPSDARPESIALDETPQPLPAPEQPPERGSVAMTEVPAAEPAVPRADYGPEPGTVSVSGATDLPLADVVPAESLSWKERVRQVIEPAIPWLVCGWLAGVIGLSARLLAGWRVIRRIQRISTSPAPSEWRDRLENLARRMGVRRAVRLLESALVEVPTVIGWLRPMILIPASALVGLTPSQLEALLAHELAHVRRHDYLVNLIQSTIETLLFYHPAIWWISRRVREERENCCDDLAVAVCGDTLQYARALATMEELRSQPVLTLAADGGSLLKRIRRLVLGAAAPRTTTGRSITPSGVLAVLGIAAVCMALAFATQTQRTAQASAEEVSAAPVVADKSETAPGQPLLVEFPDRTSVELLGVAHTETPSAEGWRPDGRRFEEVPDWPDAPKLEFMHESSRKPEMRDFVVRLKGIGSRHLAWRFPGLPTWRNPGRGDVSTLRIPVGRIASDAPITFRVGISEPEWGPLQRVDLNGVVTSSEEMPRFCRESYERVRPEAPEKLLNSVVFRWNGLRNTDDFVDAEVVAIDKSGRRHQPGGSTAWGDEPFRATVFSLAAEDIDHFEYRLRPWRHWVTFENVSLKPGTTTEPKMRSQSNRHVAQLSDKVSMELVGITRGTAAAGEGWTAEGRSLRDPGEWPPGPVFSRDKNGMSTGTSGKTSPDARDLLLEFSGLSELPSINLSPLNGSQGWQLHPLKDPYKSRVGFLQRDPTPTTDLRIGLATEPWGRWLQWDRTGKPLNSLEENDRYRASYDLIRVEHGGPASGLEGGSELRMRWPADRHARFTFDIRAIDDAGKAHSCLMRREESKLNAPECVTTWDVDVAPEKLVRFEYRLRPYRHWVTFEGVSLDRERKTNVRGAVETISLADATRQVLTTRKDRERAYALGDDLAAKVNRAIDQGTASLVRRQKKDGSWSMQNPDQYAVGTTSLAVTALIQNGMPLTAEPVKKGLDYLRSLKDPEPDFTYDLALLISALAAADDDHRDIRRLIDLVKRLEKSQLKDGSWTYQSNAQLLLSGDRSNGQYAVLALRDAAEVGIPVSRETWERVRKHWLNSQQPAGSWSYAGEGPNVSPGTGSMTATGISALAITRKAIENDAKARPEDASLLKAIAWLGENFSVNRNPGGGRLWLYYYLYSLARAGELSGERLFGEHDWYREGAEYLVSTQEDGLWKGDQSIEKNEILATSYALLFLARGPIQERRAKPNDAEKPAPESKKPDATKPATEQGAAAKASEAPAVSTDSGTSTEAKAIAEALERRVTLRAAAGTALRDTLGTIAQQHRISIRFEEETFQAAGVDIQSWPAIDLPKMPLRDALQLLLEPSLHAASVEPVIINANGVLFVAARSRVPRRDDSLLRSVTSIEGVIKDAQGKPVAGCLVTMSDNIQRTFAVTDDAGAFRAPVPTVTLRNLTVIAASPSQELQASWRVKSPENGSNLKVDPLNLTLAPARKPK